MKHVFHSSISQAAFVILPLAVSQTIVFVSSMSLRIMYFLIKKERENSKKNDKFVFCITTIDNIRL